LEAIAVPKSNANPVNKILSKLMIERSISSSCQNKKTILNKKENNMNQAEKPNSNAYRFEV
jgi:hypothetical protein